jgi:hypothetical protein
MAHGKAQFGGAAADGSVDARIVHLGCGAAIGADQELATVCLLRMGAADKGIQAFDPVHQAMGQEEIEGAVDRGWGGAALGCRQGA